MARRRKPANKKAPANAPAPQQGGDVAIEPELSRPVSPPLVAITEPLTIDLPSGSPPLLDTGVVLAPTHKKFGKFRCLLGEAAGSSPSSSSDDQTPVVEEWCGAGVIVAEEVILTEHMELSQEEVVVTREEEVIISPDDEMSMEIEIPTIEIVECPSIETEQVVETQICVEQEMECQIPVIQMEPVLECQMPEEVVLECQEVVDEDSSKTPTELKTVDIEPSFEKLSILPVVEISDFVVEENDLVIEKTELVVKETELTVPKTELTVPKADLVVDKPELIVKNVDKSELIVEKSDLIVEKSDLKVESDIEMTKVDTVENVPEPPTSEPTQDEGSIDADSCSSQPAMTESSEHKESKGEGTDTDTSSSAASSNSSSAPTARRRSSRIRHLQESLASSRDPLPAAVASSVIPEEDEETSNPTTPVTLLPPQAPPPSAAKPVKVKSRWRRSSELEMICNPNSGSPLSGMSPPSAHSSPRHSESESESKMDTKPEVKPPTVGVRPLAALPADEERLRSYEHLKENVYLTERERNKETKRMVCDCFLSKEEIARGDQGCGEDCLNRLLMIECSSRCPLGEKCSNKRFQRHEYCPLEIFRTEKKGFGLRTTVDIQGGEFLTEYLGEVLDPKEFRRRAKDYAKDKNRHYYFMALKSDAIIDATQKGNHSRFINHSCDPNAETQKWTVNGELRIGFFSTKSLVAGEEMTFDYQFQRYGKEAQRCYCESSNCRGWIGEDPEKDEKEEKPSKSRKGSDKKDRRRDKSKHSGGRDVKDLLEDMDLEQEVEKLCSSGLKNRAHTLTLCRLMVRVEDRESRARLLQLLRTAEPACRRLFLDYHGLRLIWSWMIDTDNSLKSEILETLTQLPIPNKTVLQDSKILAVVERWASDTTARSPDESTGDSTTPKPEPTTPKAEPATPKSEPSTPKSEPATPKAEPATPKSEPATPKLEPATPKSEPVTPQKEGEEPMEGTEESRTGDQEAGEEEEEDTKTVTERRVDDAEAARKLLESWSGLKEVFRIPKKERIEQMKEHEREADRGYKEYLVSNTKPRVDRYRSGLGSSSSSSSGGGVLSGSNAVAIGSNKRMRDRETRDSPDPAIRKAQRIEERILSRLSKYERRQLFELRVEKEDRARREEQIWHQQQQQQMAMSQHPAAPYMLDANGIPCYWDPTSGAWHQLGHFPPGHIPDQSGRLTLGQGGPHIHPHPPGDMNFPPGHQFDPTRGDFHPHPMFDAAQQQMQWTPQIPMGQPAVPLLPPTAPVPIPPIPIPPLPPKWKAAYDNKGQPYYYHVRLRVPQWEPPPFNQTQPLPPAESPTSSESSEESEEFDEEEEEEEEEEDSASSEEEPQPEKVEEEPEEEEEESEENEEGGAKPEQTSELPAEPAAVAMEEVKEEPKEDEVEEEMAVDAAAEVTTKDEEEEDTSPPVETKPLSKKEVRRRGGLVTEIIISPRREEDEPTISSNKKYREIKERLRRQKEKEAARKQRASSSSRSGSKSSSKSGRERRREKHKSASADGDDTIVDHDSELGRKIKEQFRLKMASVMVSCLNPFRKSDCKSARITSTEDFKHLARKLTHFVMLKELKHCKNVTDLVCNDNVKHKARDFVKKYMTKFGESYQREAEN